MKDMYMYAWFPQRDKYVMIIAFINRSRKSSAIPCGGGFANF